MESNSPSEKRPLAAVILAAGDSTRMKSSLTKVLHPLAGLPMIVHVVRAVRSADPDGVVIVVGKNREPVRQALVEFPVELAEQDRPLGTAHALLSAAAGLELFRGDLLVLCGDTPLIRGDTLVNLIAFHRATGNEASLLTCRFGNPFGYGRIIRGGTGRIQSIVEENDATDVERKVDEINTGIYCFRAPRIFEHLEDLCAEQRDGEYYLTDIVAKYNGAGLPVDGVSIDDELEVAGINTRAQLALAEGALRERIRKQWMTEGVSLIDPNSVIIDTNVEIGRDTTIYPFVIIEGGSKIGAETTVGPYCRIVGSDIGRGVRLMGWNYLEGASIPDHHTLQPFAGNSP